MRYNKHNCLVCGKEFEYCRSCVIEPIKHLAEGHCSETCAEIFNILSKHGCHLATAEETLAALKGYDTTNVTESIKAHIDSLQPKKVEEKIEAEVKTEAKAVETKSKKFSFRTQE
jgi:hypothetical protein